MDAATGSGLDRFTADAGARGIDVEIVVRPAARSLAEAAALMGIAPFQIVKSLVVRHKDGSFMFVLIPGGRQISWPKLRAAVGVNRLSLPDAETALEATGYARGTITPLGSTTAWPVYADGSIAGRRISIGAGQSGHAAFVDADTLLAGVGAHVADLSEPEAGSGD